MHPVCLGLFHSYLGLFHYCYFIFAWDYFITTISFLPGNISLLLFLFHSCHFIVAWNYFILTWDHQVIDCLIKLSFWHLWFRPSSDRLPYLEVCHKFYSCLFWFWWDHFAICDSKFGSIYMLGTQLYHILASNVNKYKYKISRSMNDAILGNYILHIQKWQYL